MWYNMTYMYWYYIGGREAAEETLEKPRAPEAETQVAGTGDGGLWQRKSEDRGKKVFFTKRTYAVR